MDLYAWGDGGGGGGCILSKSGGLGLGPGPGVQVFRLGGIWSLTEAMMIDRQSDREGSPPPLLNELTHLGKGGRFGRTEKKNFG